MNGLGTPRTLVRRFFRISQLYRRPSCWSQSTPAAALVLLLSLSARGDLYQGFDYPVQGGVVAGSLSDPTGTLATRGNHFRGTDEIQLPDTMGTPGTDVWISWLQRGDQTASAFQGLELLEPKGTTATGLYFVGEPGSGPGDGAFVIGKAGDDANVVSSGVPAVSNHTAFLVAHLQFRDGNDMATLFVNPTPGTTEPAAGVTYSGLDFPVVRPLLVLDGIGNGATFDFDELRVGSSYAAVAPVAPEPAGAAAAGSLLMLLSRRPRTRRPRAPSPT